MASETVNNVELLFSSYSDEKGYVHSNVLNELVCELGYAPSLKEMSDFKKKTGDQCDLSSFKEFLKTIVHPEDTHANLTELFRFYDPNNTGRISKKQLEKLLTNVGEYLSEKELERFFSVLCNEDDEVDYEDLVNKYYKL
uniref:Calmodulin n=1 Tax=Theileria annulata TaxID=5874 RepID=A0A3B0MZL8_THEAN